MPSGKYYCDHCNKQFQDTPAARRRHLQGSAHQRAKALWYDAVRAAQLPDQVQVQPRSFGKGVCNRFVRTEPGFVLALNVELIIEDFHKANQAWLKDLTDVEKHLRELALIARRGSCQYGDSCKYYHPQNNAAHTTPTGMRGGSFVQNTSFQGIPGALMHEETSLPALMPGNQMGASSLINLPPSLWPPPEGGYPPLPFVDWG